MKRSLSDMFGPDLPAPKPSTKRSAPLTMTRAFTAEYGPDLAQQLPARNPEKQKERQPGLKIVFDWPARWLERLCGLQTSETTNTSVVHATATQQERLFRLQTVLARGLTVSTAFSGIDTPIMALNAIIDTLEENGWSAEGAITGQHACDSCEACQKVLTGWRGEPRADHVFADVEEFATPQVRKKLDFLAENLQDQAFQEMRKYLQKQGAKAFPATAQAQCLVHKTKCPVRSFSKHDRRCTLAVAGSPCVAWTTMLGAKQTKTQHATAKPLPLVAV